MAPGRRFAFRLALALGQPNPDAMLTRMPYRVFLEWIKFYRLEPFGEERADLRAAIVASVMANLWGREKGAPPYSPEIFMPKFGPPEPDDPEMMLQKIMMINAMLGGEFIDLHNEDQQESDNGD